MASCFRTVSNRLCCSCYLKTPVVNHLDLTTASPSKVIQCDNLKKNNSSLYPSAANLISNSINHYNTPSTHLQSTRFVLSTTNLTSQDIIMWYRRENGLLGQFPPVTGETLKNTVLLAESAKSSSNKTPEDPVDCGRPSEDTLEQTMNILSEDLTRLFVKPINYTIYHQNIVLENNIRGTRHVGIGKYATQIALLKAAGHLKFAYVKFTILKITKHPEEGTIKCRWRIQGISGMHALANFLNFTPSRMVDQIKDAPTWYDGFSIYHVGSNGRIFKHVIDKMMPDDDKVVSVQKPGITKLAMFLGLAPPEERAVFMNILNDYFKDHSCLSSVMLPLEKLE